MNALSYLQPENQIANWIVAILLILFAIWLALLVYGGLQLMKQRRRMSQCDEVEGLAQPWRAASGVEGASLAPKEESQVRKQVFKEFCDKKKIEENSVVARHLKSIFEAGCEESRLEIGGLIKHTTNELFQWNGLLRSVLATFIIFGLLGSLFGLADSLSHLTLGVGTQSNEQLSQNLADLLGKLKSAFAPSICGILLTILGVFFYTLYLQLICSPIRNLLESMTLNIWVPKLFPTVTQKLQETLLHSERQMKRSIEAASRVAEFAESIEQGGGALKQNLDEANKTLALVTMSAKMIGNFTEKFTESVTALSGFQLELRKLYESINQESKVFQADVKANIEKAEVFYENSRKTIDNQHQQLEAALKGLAAYETAYIESRQRLDTSIEEVLAQAKKAYEDIGQRNQEIVEALGNPLREEMKKSLSEVADTLAVQLRKIQGEFIKFDAPIKSAADKVAGALESVVKRTETLTREMQSELITLEEKHLAQTAHMEGISSLLNELNGNSKLQGEQIQAWSQAMGALTQSLSEISGGMKEFAQSLKLSGHDPDRYDERDKQMIAALDKLLKQGQFQHEQERLLFNELLKKIGSLNDSVRSDGRTAGSKAKDEFVLSNDKNYKESPWPEEKKKSKPRLKERRFGWKNLINAAWRRRK